MKHVLLIVLSFPMVTSCEINHYHGDGTLEDNTHGWGMFDSGSRYHVVLGTVDLSRNGEVRFHAAGLPARDFDVGVELNPADCKLKQSEMNLSITVKNEHGQKVISESHPLKSFVWSAFLNDQCNIPFGYIRGRGKDVQIGANQYCVKTNYTGADHGSGTSFTSRPSGSYEIDVLVSGVPTGAGSHVDRVVLRDGGPVMPPVDKRCE